MTVKLIGNVIQSNFNGKLIVNFSTFLKLPVVLVILFFFAFLQMLVLAFQIVLWSGMQLTTMSISETLVYVALFKFFNPILLCYGMKMVGLQCFDSVGWAAGRASGL